MKTPKPSEPPADAAPEAATEAGAEPRPESEAPARPAPEPLTPEAAVEWNAYYDRWFIRPFVLVLCFVAAANLIENSTIWTHLRAGQLIESYRRPITTEPFSYAAENRRWVNVTWLFEWLSFRTYMIGRSIGESLGGAAKADAAGAAALVGLSATIRALTALVLMGLRRRGPGLWWSALTTALALGVILTPIGGTPLRFGLGGIAGLGAVTPSAWGLLLAAVELLLLHRAFNEGRRWALGGLVPLFVVWANVDETFGVGLILLLARAVGSGLRPAPAVLDQGEAGDRRPPGLVVGLGLTAACVAACLVNPSTFRAFAPGFGPLIEVFQPIRGAMTNDQLTLIPFGPRAEMSRLEGFGPGYGRLVGFYLALVGTGAAGFLINRRRFDLGRFLMFAAAAVLTAMLWRFHDLFALVWAGTLALNGQEWYRGAYGVEGRLGLGWRLWSVGGRFVTLMLVAAAILGGLTGSIKQQGEPLFGFGYEPDRFAFEAADYLYEAPIEGRVLNLRFSLGDALNWRAYPKQKPYLDTRQHTQDETLLERFETARTALAEGDEATWRPILRGLGVSVVMVDLPLGRLRSALTDRLDGEDDWVAFYDDGQVILYGSLDESVAEADRAFFRSQRLDAEAIVFERGAPVRPFDRPPQPTGWIDRLMKGRALAIVQPHVRAAQRWLTKETDEQGLPPLAACIRAVQETRNALSVRPDDTDAFLVQSIAYRYLSIHETRLLAEAGNADVQAGAIIAPMRVRIQQRMTALNAFLQTAPQPPPSPEGLLSLREGHLELGKIYLDLGYLDLARDQLAAALDLFDESTATEAMLQEFAEVRQRYEALEEQMADLNDRIEQAELEGQADALQLAAAAEQQGAVGLAIELLEEANAAGLGLASVPDRLVDLYCDIGQPDRALEYLGAGGDQATGATPGVPYFRQGRTFFLLGDYRTAAELWGNYAIPQLQASRTQSALQTTLELLRSNPIGATDTALRVPNMLKQQAEWEYILGLAQLEGGYPSAAGPPFRTSLEMNPEIDARPIAAEYLRRLGLEVPPPPEESAGSDEGAEDTAPASDEPTAEAPPADESSAEEPPAPDVPAPSDPDSGESESPDDEPSA